MNEVYSLAMIGHFIGSVIFLLGLLALFLPLGISELSRPKDLLIATSAMVLGLVTFTNNPHINFTLILAEISGLILITRLFWEVAHSRWLQLEPKEKIRIQTIERWMTSFQELSFTFLKFPAFLSQALHKKIPQENSLKKKKKWVRPDQNPFNSFVESGKAEGNSPSDIKKEEFLDHSKETTYEKSHLKDS